MLAWSPRRRSAVRLHRNLDFDLQYVELTTAAGVALPALSGSWSNDGFAGSLAARGVGGSVLLAGATNPVWTDQNL